MMKNLNVRGEAFARILRRIAATDRRVGDDILLFDDYTVTPLMLKPLRTEYTVAVEVLEGKGRAMVNDVEYAFEAPCLMVFVPGQVFQITAIPDAPLKSRVMVLSETFMNGFYGMSYRLNEIFATLLIAPVIPLDSHGRACVDSFVKSCILTISDLQNPYRYDVIRHLTMALFYGALVKICNRSLKNGKRASMICAEFTELVRSRFAEQHKLDFYASELCITPRYLSVCVKSVTGKTPAYWIDFHILSEAKRLLRQTDRTIDRISDELGFGSQSVFGKFFKRLTGMSPSDWRNGNSARDA